MKKSIARVLALVALVGASPAVAQDALIDKQGFAWETGGIPPSTSGDVFNVVAFVNEIDPRFNVDLSQEEVTVYATDLVSTGQVDLGGGFFSVAYTGGTIELWRDLSKNHTFGINPPNATVPASFTDGTLLLGGTFIDFILFFDTSTGSGAYEGHIQFSTGSGLGDLGQTGANAYTFAGLLDFDASGGNVPEGYDLQVDGRIEVEGPVAVQEETWSAVKHLYRP